MPVAGRIPSGGGDSLAAGNLRGAEGDDREVCPHGNPGLLFARDRGLERNGIAGRVLSEGSKAPCFDLVDHKGKLGFIGGTPGTKTAGAVFFSRQVVPVRRRSTRSDEPDS